MKPSDNIYKLLKSIFRRRICVLNPQSYEELFIKTASSYDELVDIVNSNRRFKKLGYPDRNYQNIASAINAIRNAYDNKEEDYYIVYMSPGKDKFKSLFMVHRKDTHYLPDDYRPDGIKKGKLKTLNRMFTESKRLVSHCELDLQAAEDPIGIVIAERDLRASTDSRDDLKRQREDSLKEEQRRERAAKPRRWRVPSEDRIKKILEEDDDDDEDE